MQLKKKPVNGMKDILPKEMEIREYVLDVMRKTYKSFGFVSMETPCVEHLENLNSKQGGDNEKLIFRILKRGEKLKLEEAKSDLDLTDSGLRYDLTVPLCRYYSNNANDLPSPFKALQAGNVWRADRPQKGRYRQFMQCDIDIIGEASNLAEIELILATGTFLEKIGFSGFSIRINDRRILKAMAASCGFAEDDFDTVFIILDKMDKIGAEGVKAELLEQGFSVDSVDKYLALFENAGSDTDAIIKLKDELAGDLDPAIADGLIDIFDCVNASKSDAFSLRFDPTLVRGMSYYTGPIFEITMDEFGSSVGGGGRYDELVGKFTGQSAPACGFSVGFERIVMLLLEKNFTIPGGSEKIAFLVEKGADPGMMKELVKKASELRKEGNTVSVCVMKKNRKFQKEQLSADGYTQITEIFAK